MIIQYFWRNCDFWGRESEVEPIDGFWIEATKKEAESLIFPRLKPAEIVKSRELADQLKGLAKELGHPLRLFCFLVSRDFQIIKPMEGHYPFGNLWNGYSPFEWMEEIEISRLEDVLNIALPAKKDKEGMDPPATIRNARL